MKFTYYRTGGWNRRFPQFVIAFMQLSGAVFTELINIILICSQDTSKEIIMNLLAFSVIAEIDDFYAGTLKNSLMVHLIEEGKINFGQLGRDNRDPLQVNKATTSKILFGFYRTMQTLYDALYFYFAAYLTFLFTFV